MAIDCAIHAPAACQGPQAQHGLALRCGCDFLSFAIRLPMEPFAEGFSAQEHVRNTKS